MIKLIVQLVTMGGIWFGTRAAGAHWALALLAVAIGVFIVHFIWERFVFQPFAYLGAMPVASDDALMAEACAKAKATFPKLRELFPEHPKDTCVRFAFRVKDGKIERVWGDLLELTEVKAKIYLRTMPVAPADIPDRTMEIDVEDIDDWSIEFRDGTLRGGFTNRALFSIFEREQGYMHPEFLKHIARFKDA